MCPEACFARGRNKVQKVIACQGDRSAILLRSCTNESGCIIATWEMPNQLHHNFGGRKEKLPPESSWNQAGGALRGQEWEGWRCLLIDSAKLWGLWMATLNWSTDQKVPSWNPIISTVSRLKFKWCAAIWRPSGQGLVESPVIRSASYYRNPKSYLNSSLMGLWFPRAICCYCRSVRMTGEATNQSCFLTVPERAIRGTRERFSWS